MGGSEQAPSLRQVTARLLVPLAALAGLVLGVRAWMAPAVFTPGWAPPSLVADAGLVVAALSFAVGASLFVEAMLSSVQRY